MYESLYNGSNVSVVSSLAAAGRAGAARAAAPTQGHMPPGGLGPEDSCSELGASALDSSSDGGSGATSRYAVSHSTLIAQLDLGYL